MAETTAEQLAETAGIEAIGIAALLAARNERLDEEIVCLTEALARAKSELAQAQERIADLRRQVELGEEAAVRDDPT